jgi:ubiquinone biosynthesis protein
MNIQDLGRLRSIAGVLVRHGFGHLVSLAGIEGRGEDGASGLPLGTRLRLAMTELGSTYVKLGQVLSLRPDIVPAEVALELEKLQSKVPAADWGEVEALLTRELGMTLEERFESFEREPIASASVAQVHRAVLPDGTPVAVKVQRPGIREVIESDLHILYTLAHLLAGQLELPGLYTPLAIVKEFDAALQQELDFLQEARAATRFRQLFNESARITAPRVFAAYSTSRVLVMEMLEGEPITDFAGRGEESERVLDLLIEATYRQVFEFGFFHGDPHPGNVWVLEDGSLAFLDFGLTGRLTREMQDTIISLFLGVVFRDAETVTLTLYKAGATDGRVDLRSFRREIDRLMMRFHGLSMAELADRSNLVEFVEVASRYRIQLVAEYTIIARTASMLDGVARELCPDVDIVEKVTPYAQRLVGNRLSPGRISEDLVRVIQHAQVALQDVPMQLSQLMSDVESGNIQVRTRVEDIDDLHASVRRAGIRLSISVLSASLGISGAILLVPELGEVQGISISMLLGAILGLLSLGMFMGLLLHVAMASRMHPSEIRRQFMAVIRFFTRRSG